MIKFNPKKDYKIFFSSDLHGLHKNICYGTSNWDNKENSTRKFDNPNSMTDVIIDNINKLVSYDDKLFLLGDLLFHYKDVDSYIRFLNRINCNNMFLLYGNHDHRENLRQACLIINDYNKKISISDYLEIEIDGKLICMSHYPMARWNNRHNKRSYMLFGHEHGKFDNGELSLDVGIDNAFKLFREYRPFSWKEVQTILK